MLVAVFFTACTTSNLPTVSGPKKEGGTGGGLPISKPNKGKGGNLPTISSPNGKRRSGDPFAAAPKKTNPKKKKKEKGLFPPKMRR